MSVQGSSAKTKSAARENGQQARENGQKPKEESVDETTATVEQQNTSPEEKPLKADRPLKADNKIAETRIAEIRVEEEDTNDTVRVRPVLTSEAPPPAAPATPVETPKKSKTAQARLPRKAHLVLRRVEPWSAMKFSFVLSLVCFVVLFVAVAVLYGVLSALGVFDSIISMFNQLNNSDGQNTLGFDIKSWFEPVRILGYTALIGAVNVVLITALSTLGAVIYNVAADLVGGVEVTFSEAE
ncbi:DUF3566 domain-containing protein [Nonomuraea soli]|uniref:Flp pilus assembly pilin Flp n=1 Tax=Nonomuraea soli TaxID=1032476 RepID=A0A7W0CIS1_9ACTN|nr:DUF3566 domain-containing protein [Nonomuraea soli]MBA2891809.1 Flp pilus assembly pilin Flp [Nonomuraea soli]